MYNSLTLKTEKNIATITLNRPETNNAFDETLFREVTQAVEQCTNDNDVQVIIITGSGKNFSSGGDINSMKTFDFITPELSIMASNMTGLVRRCPKPVIAMINGTAAGAACALALSCDFRIMTEKSSLLTAFSNVALSGDSGVMYHLYHIVGLAKTIELMILSDPIRGEEALKLGLATKLVSDSGNKDDSNNSDNSANNNDWAENTELKKSTMEFAERLKTRPLAAFAKQKKVYYYIFYNDFEKYRKLEAELFVESSESGDHHEAVTAFFERRKPVFNQK